MMTDDKEDISILKLCAQISAYKKNSKYICLFKECFVLCLLIVHHSNQSQKRDVKGTYLPYQTTFQKLELHRHSRQLKT